MSSMVVKPKERQFQVVPVPAVFTRGRWECVDYKDGTANGSSAAATIPSSAATPQNGREGGGASIQPAPSATPQFSIGPSEPPPASTTTTNTEFDNKSVISGGGGGAATPAACPAVASTTTTTTTTAATGATAGPNSVAIDNKIEQAMDLVKTHLTFAVREEVEILRSTITDLELRVNLLENENQILRQFSPADVVANLPALVQQATQQQQKAAAAAHQQQAAAQKTFQTVPSAPVIMDTTSSSSQQPPPHAQHNADRQHQARRSSPTPGPGGGGGGDEIL